MLAVSGGVTLFIIVWGAVGCMVGQAIGRPKGRAVEGFWLGLFFGVIGWIVVGVWPPNPSVGTLDAAVERARRQRDQGSEPRVVSELYSALEELQQRLASGAITQDQYDAEKKKLFG
jgi:hypothetical protein